MPRWLAAAYPRWFTHPRLADRLAILHVSRTAEQGTSPIRIAHLRAILDGTSHLR